MMKSRMLLWGTLAIAFSLTGCLDSPDNSLFENRYNENFEAMLGGKIDKSQTWVTGSVIQANVRTSGAATINVYTLGKETRILYARQKVNGSGQLRFAIPQNKDAYIAFEADYGDAEKVYRKMDLSLDLKQLGDIDLTRTATTRGMATSNSVPNPPAALCGNSNQRTEDGYAGHHFGYTTFPGWAWDNLATAVPEANGTKPHQRDQITNYELISTGPFYLSLLYGCTGTYDERTLGYYYYKEEGNYSDLVMVDLVDVLTYDYIDGYAKVQYQRIGESSKWMDANFDYKDGDGLTANKSTTSQVNRRGDNAFNTLLVNKEYKGVTGVQGIRGLTFQINVPIGYRLGFYLKSNQTNNTQKETLRSLGVAEKYLTGRATCFSGSALNLNTQYKYRSIIQKFDGYTFMGLEDNPSGGDLDSNDVTFGLTAGNGGSLPGVLLPGVKDLDKNQYYNNDGTVTDEPKESYVQNVIEGRDPFDYGTTQPSNPSEILPSVSDLPAWTIGYEDLGTSDDFDFNDVVLRVVPNTADKAKVYLCATGGSLNAEIHYDGPSGDINLGTSHQLLGSMVNTNGTMTKPAALIGEVDWPTTGANAYTMATDAWRFYILVGGQKIAVNKEPGVAPKAICAQGDWHWPSERTNLFSAYPMVGRWGLDINNSDARDWYNHPKAGAVVSF